LKEDKKDQLGRQSNIVAVLQKVQKNTSILTQYSSNKLDGLSTF